ncbi:MAG: hypothetical protein PHE11_04255 [Candidatus Omnitrophica bacterium]|nr:hypothetical protein [Candidatus Omnitrophota bacterium]
MDEQEQQEMEKVRSEAEAEIFGGVEPTQEPNEVAPPAAKEPEADNAAADPWAGVAPALREQMEGMSQRLSSLDEITNRLKTAEGRVSALQSELAKKATQDVKKTPGAAPSAAQVDAAATDAEWEELKEDFPEWANALERRIAATNESVRSLISKEQARMTEEVERRIVSIKHPGYQKTIQDPDFKTWFQAQPAEFQKLANSMKADDAITVLDGYAAARGKGPSRIQDRKKRLQEAATIPKGSQQAPIKSEADMTEAELRKKIASEIWET